MLSAGIVILSYAIGSIPIAYITGRLVRGIDIREYGSGNAGASNVWQSVSRWLVVPVGVAQIAQGFAGILIARAAGEGEGTQVAAGLAALAANNWSPWLGFTGGRGVGQAIGFLLVMSPAALGVFIAVALAGVVMVAVPQAVGLGITLSPVVAAVSGEAAVVVLGCTLLAALIFAKRLRANSAPATEYARPAVWWYRLAYDRDTREREQWVHRKPPSPEAQAG